MYLLRFNVEENSSVLINSDVMKSSEMEKTVDRSLVSASLIPWKESTSILILKFWRKITLGNLPLLSAQYKHPILHPE